MRAREAVRPFALQGLGAGVETSVLPPRWGRPDPGLLFPAGALLSQGGSRTTGTRSRAGLGCFSTS